MPKIIILPNLNLVPYGYVIKLNNYLLNFSLCELLIMNNINIPHVCEKFGKCTTCKVIIIEGSKFINKIEFEEFEILNIEKKKLNYRLSCQIFINLNFNIIINID